MPVSAFGYKSMTLNELISALQAIAATDPKQGGSPVWVAPGPHGVFKPVRAVSIHTTGRPTIEVHNG